MFINLLLNHQEIRCVEERYVRNLRLIKLGTAKNIHGRRNQLASEDLAPDQEERIKMALGQISRIEAMYKNYKRTTVV